MPTQAFANLDNNAFLQLDLSKNLYPFGKDPKADCVLYLASPASDLVCGETILIDGGFTAL